MRPARFLVGGGEESGPAGSPPDSIEVTAMMNVVFVVVTLLFFGASWLYVMACDRV
jgi:hypothetical protein